MRRAIREARSFALDKIQDNDKANVSRDPNSRSLPPLIKEEARVASSAKRRAEPVIKIDRFSLLSRGAIQRCDCLVNEMLHEVL